MANESHGYFKRLADMVGELRGTAKPSTAGIEPRDPLVVLPASGDSPATRARLSGVDELTIEDYALWSQRSR